MQSGESGSLCGQECWKAVGEYIIFIDADDRLELNMLSLMLSDAKTYEADMVICGIQKWNDIGMISQKTVSRGIEIFGKEEALRFFFRGGKFELGAWNKLIKRSVVDGIDFDINRKMNEDKFFCFEALKNSLKIIYHDENLYCYYQRNTSATYKPFDSRWFDNDYFAERIYESTKESFPQLEREARYQMLMSKYYLLLVMLRRKAGGQFRKEYSNLVKDIKEIKICDIVDFISYRARISLFLVRHCAGLYTFINKVRST